MNNTQMWIVIILTVSAAIGLLFFARRHSRRLKGIDETDNRNESGGQNNNSYANNYGSRSVAGSMQRSTANNGGQRSAGNMQTTTRSGGSSSSSGLYQSNSQNGASKSQTAVAKPGPIIRAKKITVTRPGPKDKLPRNNNEIIADCMRKAKVHSYQDAKIHDSRYVRYTNQPGRKKAQGYWEFDIHYNASAN